MLVKEHYNYDNIDFNVSLHSLLHAAQRAMDILRFDCVLLGKKLRITWCERDPSRRRTGIGNVVIKNLDISTDVRALYDKFRQFGDIRSFEVKPVSEGKRQCIGFVQYDNQEAADKAIHSANGATYGDKQM